MRLPEGTQVSIIAEGSPDNRMWRASCYVLANPSVGTRGHGPMTFTAYSPDFVELLGIVDAKYAQAIDDIVAEQRPRKAATKRRR